LLPLVAAHLSGARQKSDRVIPFVERQIDIAHEIMEVTDEARHDGLEASILCLREACDHGVGNVVLIEIAHDASPARRLMPASHRRMPCQGARGLPPVSAAAGWDMAS